ncbi:hypothetical protein EMIT0P258_110203 [Pseudomonas sp. IT-P258]
MYTSILVCYLFSNRCRRISRVECREAGACVGADKRKWILIYSDSRYIRAPLSRFCSRCVSDLSERGGSKMTLGETGRFSAGAYGEFSYSDRKTLTHPTAGEALNYFTGANANGTRRCRLCFLPSVA